MEVFKPFWTVYNVFDRMKNNDQQCPHVQQRIQALEKLVRFIEHDMPGQLPDDVKDALENLGKTVTSAALLITKFMETHKLNQMVKASDYKSEFESLNKSLTDSFVTLSVALHVHQEKKLDEQEIKLAKQEQRLAQQENILQRVESKLALHVHQEKKLDEQEIKLAKQEQRLAQQENKIAEQEDILQRVESKLDYQNRGYYCILQ